MCKVCMPLLVWCLSQEPCSREKQSSCLVYQRRIKTTNNKQIQLFAKDNMVPVVPEPSIQALTRALLSL